MYTAQSAGFANLICCRRPKHRVTVQHTNNGHEFDVFYVLMDIRIYSESYAFGDGSRSVVRATAARVDDTRALRARDLCELRLEMARMPGGWAGPLVRIAEL